MYSFIHSFIHLVIAICNKNPYKSNSCFHYKAAICMEKASEHLKIYQYIDSIKVGMKTNID